MNLARWIALTIHAAYPFGQRADAAKAAGEYLRWLDSLPVVR
jgi:hypothetical protein